MTTGLRWLRSEVVLFVLSVCAGRNFIPQGGCFLILVPPLSREGRGIGERGLGYQKRCPLAVQKLRGDHGEQVVQTLMVVVAAIEIEKDAGMRCIGACGIGTARNHFEHAFAW